MHHRHHDAHEQTGLPSRLKHLLALLCLAQLMVILDISAVNVALPDMAKDLGIAGGDIGWTVTSYSLVFGSLLHAGRPAGRPGRPAADVPDRPGRVHGGLDRRRDGR